MEERGNTVNKAQEKFSQFEKKLKERVVFNICIGPTYLCTRNVSVMLLPVSLTGFQTKATTTLITSVAYK